MRDRLTGQRIVIKMGGSVLDSNVFWVESMREMLDKYRHDQVLLIVGGGEIVEAIRILHAKYPQLDEEFLHWECVNLLDSTCRIASQLMPLELIETADALQQKLASRTSFAAWVLVRIFYNTVAIQSIPPEIRPAHTWQSTTDTLAILLGCIIGADEVVLLKSCELREGLNLEEAVECGIVDSESPRLAKNAFRGKVSLRSICKSNKSS